MRLDVEQALPWSGENPKPRPLKIEGSATRKSNISHSGLM